MLHSFTSHGATKLFLTVAPARLVLHYDATATRLFYIAPRNARADGFMVLNRIFRNHPRRRRH